MIIVSMFIYLRLVFICERRNENFINLLVQPSDDRHSFAPFKSCGLHFHTARI
jgi:hypothetical protein